MFPALWKGFSGENTHAHSEIHAHSFSKYPRLLPANFWRWLADCSDLLWGSKKCSQIPLHTLTMHVLSNLYPGSFSGLRQEPLHNANTGEKKVQRNYLAKQKGFHKTCCKNISYKNLLFWLCFLLFNVKYYWLNKTQIVKQVPAGCNI